MRVTEHLHGARPRDVRRLARYLRLRTAGFTDGAVVVMIRYALGQR